VIKEGDIGDKFFLIVEGSAIATKVLEEGKEAVKVKDYEKSDYFGERALLMNEPRAANIVVTSDSLVTISMERKTFIRMMGPLEDLLKRNMELYEKFTLKK
jgi:cAMP-dependent protein kinase regulator